MGENDVADTEGICKRRGGIEVRADVLASEYALVLDVVGGLGIVGCYGGRTWRLSGGRDDGEDRGVEFFLPDPCNAAEDRGADFR